MTQLGFKLRKENSEETQTMPLHHLFCLMGSILVIKTFITWEKKGKGGGDIFLQAIYLKNGKRALREVEKMKKRVSSFTFRERLERCGRRM